MYDVQSFLRVRVRTSMRDAIIRADGMRTGTVVQCFGPFELDPTNGRLFRGQTRVRLSDPQAAILLRLVAHAGQVVSKEALVEAGWGTVAIGGNNLYHTMFPVS